MFRVAQVSGNGSEQQLLSMDATKEGAIHSIAFNNTTGSGQTVAFKVGLIEFKYEFTESSIVRDMKINVPVDTMVTVKAPSGVTVTASYVEMSIDPAAALSAAQSIAQNIFDQANHLRATLPSGTISDGEPSDDSTWSSEKINNEISSVFSNIKYYTANDVDVGSMLYFAHTKFDGALYGGNENPTFTTRLNYGGNFHATTFIEPSDARLKEDVVAIDGALEKVKSINGYTFKMKSSGEQKTGLIAQEVLSVLPEAVTGNDEEGYGVAYGNVVGLLVEAIKELEAKVKELEVRNG